jgi:hypothetical protein
MSAPKQQVKSSNESGNHSVVAIVHRVGSSWRCLFANPHDSATDQKQPDFLDAKIVTTDAELDALLQEKSPSQIFAILPGSSTVCRTTTLPDVGEDQIFEALRLQVEAKLLGQTSVHRRAFAALDPAIGETNRVGLIVAWPDNTAHSFPSCLNEARFIPDVASIAALLGGFRPNEPTVLADPSDGTVTISISHANGTALRATREDCTTTDSFHKGIVRVAHETASLHNHTDEFTDKLTAQLGNALEQQRNAELLLLLPPAITESASNRVSNTPSNDSTWWATWGIAVGGLLALTGSLQTLTTMRLDAKVIHPTLVQKLTERLENRTFALRLAFVAILLLAIGPALFVGVRLAMLEMRNPNIATHYASLVESRKQQIVYKELGKTAWPMTKVIADLTNNIPIGIEIESIRIDIGQPVSIRGRAIKADGKTAAELIASMQTNLQKTGMFKDITFAYDPAGTYGDREFDLWATVSDPLRRPKYDIEEDFGKWTLAMRQAGISPEEEVVEVQSPITTPTEEDASPLSMANADDIPENTDPIATFGDHEDRVVEGRPRPIGGSNGATSHSGNRGDDGPTLRVPDPISPEQIKLMNRSEVMIAVKDIAEAKKRVGRSNPELKERLQKEFRLLMDHLKELPSG